MNRFHQAGITLGTGAVMYGIAHFGMEAIMPSPEEQNRSVEACARQLGTEAVQADVLPDDCQLFQSRTAAGVPPVFDFERTTVTDSQNNVLHESAVYELPSAADFRAEHLMTPEEIAEREEAATILKLAFAGVSTVITGTGLEVVVRATRREPETQEEPVAETSE